MTPISFRDHVKLNTMRSEMNHAFDLLNKALDSVKDMDNPPESLIRDMERLKAMRIKVMLKFTRIKGFL